MAAPIASQTSQTPQTARAARVGCDIGGSFTDIILLHPDGRLFVNKTSTTPQQPGQAVVAGIRAVLAQSGLAADAIGELVHGTTVASNAILQKTGARTGVLATRGFRDVLEIGRIRTPTMFDLAWHKPEPLAPRAPAVSRKSWPAESARLTFVPWKFPAVSG